jgi:hypothetical protein
MKVNANLETTKLDSDAITALPAANAEIKNR